MATHESYSRLKEIIEQTDHEIEEIKKLGTEAAFLKKKRFSQIISFRFPGIDQKLILKIVYPHGRRASRFFRRFKKSSCLVEYQKTLHFHKQGVGVIPPIFAGEKRRFNVLKKSYYLAPMIEGTVLLKDYLDGLDNANMDQVKEKRKIIKLLGREVGRMHGKFLYHCDLTRFNILIKKNAAGHEVFLIDCVLGRFHNKHKPKLIYRDLHKLRGSALNYSRQNIINTTDLLRFLLEYCRVNPQMSPRQVIKLLNYDAK